MKINETGTSPREEISLILEDLWILWLVLLLLELKGAKGAAVVEL